MLALMLTCLTAHVYATDVDILVKNVLGDPLDEMVVYVDPLDDQVLTNIEKTISIGQLNKTFSPYINVSQVGNSIRFHNQDDITHHIYSTDNGNKFSFKIRAGKQQIKNDLTRAGEISMGCNIHDWMNGYLLVLDTPYFGKTNVQGKVSISIPEPGRYRVTVWHPQMNEPDSRLSQEITLPLTKKIALQLSQAMTIIPEQASDEDFDFLSDY